MWKSSMKNKIAKNKCEHVAEAGTYSNTKFKWWDDLIEDFIKALSNFKTVMEIFFDFFLLYFNFLNRVFGFTIQNNISFLLIFSDIDKRLTMTQTLSIKNFYIQIH